MNRRRLIILLACAYFALQVVTISSWYSLGSEETHALDLIICIAVSVVVGLLVVFAVRHLFQTMRKSEAAYATQVSELLESSLARYQLQSSQDEALIQDQLKEINHELTLARRALVSEDYDQLDKHMRAGLDAATLNVGPRCDNAIVAAILASKSRECAEANVMLTHDVTLPEDLSIQDVDLAAMLFNLIDNSLNECKALANEGYQEPLAIFVFARIQAGQIAIKVTNPCRKGTDAGRKAVVRRHNTNLLHGWGVHIVASIAASYGGVTDFQEKNGLFSASALIPER